MSAGTLQRHSGLRRVVGWLVSCATAALLLLAAILWWQTTGEADRAAPPQGSDPAQARRGEYLARIGNCSGCHSTPGELPYAGGRAIATPFGSVYSSNLTPDIETGIGAWSDQAFWRAMHHGRSRDGRLLYPAFPYPNTTHVTRADSDAILAYLRSLRPVSKRNREHALSFPYNTQIALAAWRLLYFRAAETDPVTARATGASGSHEWQRGAYLVNGLAHCSACHARRNSLGGSSRSSAFDGNLMPGEPWYAPSLVSNREGGVGDWELGDIVDLLTTGLAARGSVQGPMAEVVFASTSHLSAADARAMAVYLKSLGKDEPRQRPEKAAAAASLPPVADDSDAGETGKASSPGLQGASLYADFCAGCHGKQGEGREDAYPALAGNRSVVLDPPVNLLQIINHGGFAPATPGNPRPFGMPPFGLELSQAEMASLISFLRTAWGNEGSKVEPRDVQRWLETSPAH